MSYTRTELLQHRINAESRRAAIEERAEAKRFLEDPAPVTAFSILDAIAAQPHVDPAFRAVIRPTTLAERIAYKCGQSAENSFGEALWHARGGE
jgi:hypothetical protein